MKQRYHITPEGRAPLSDADIAKHRDVRKVMYNYQRAQHLLHRKPIYKDRRAFFALLLIVLLAVLLAEANKKDDRPEDGTEQEAPAP